MRRAGAAFVLLGVVSCRPRATTARGEAGSATPSAAVPRSRVRGDLDGDGFADVAFALAPVGLRVRFGGAVPPREQSYPPGFAPVLEPDAPAARVREALRGVRRERLVSASTAGDFDGDGRAELVFVTRDLDAPVDPEGARCAGNTVRIAGVSARELAWSGAVTLAPPPQAPARFGAYAMALPDEDRDGDDELVVLATEADTATALMQQPGGGAVERSVALCSVPVALVYQGGPAGLTTAPARSVRLAATLTPGDAALGDLDGDGAADLVLLSSSLDVFSLRASEGEGPQPRGPFISVSSAEVAAVAQSVSVADVNCDGRPDLLVGARLLEHPEPDGRRIVFGFVRGPLPAAPPVRIEWVSVPNEGHRGESLQHGALTVGDLDGDRCGEIAVGAPDMNRVLVFRTTREGPQSAPWRVIIAPEGVRRFATTIARVGDVDGDGREDLLAGQPDERVSGADADGRRSSVFLLRDLAAPAPVVARVEGAPALGLARVVGGLEAHGERVEAPAAPRICTPPSDLRAVVHVTVAPASSLRPSAGQSALAQLAPNAEALRTVVERCAREAFERDCDQSGVLIYSGRVATNGPRAAGVQFTASARSETGNTDDALRECVDHALEGAVFAPAVRADALMIRVDIGPLPR